MRFIVLPFFLGILFTLSLKVLWSVWVIASIVGFLLLLYVCTSFPRRRESRGPWTPVFTGVTEQGLILFLGILYCTLFSQHILQHRLTDTQNNQVQTIAGKIISIPIQEGDITEFIFQSTKPALRVKLDSYDATQHFSAGATCTLLVKIHQPHNFSNPGSFDEEGFFFSQKIMAQGYIKKLIDCKEKTGFDLSLLPLREKLFERIELSLKNSPYRAMIEALTVGIKNNITAEQWLVMQKTGANHLMVVAGLHIGMLFAIIFFMLHFLVRRIHFITLQKPAFEIAAYGAFVTSLCYALLAGFSIPTQRAFIMMSVFLAGLFLRRHIPLGMAYATALFFVLLFNPLSPLDIGFWLSFSAVGSILYAMMGKIHSNKWHHLTKLQWIVALGVMPATIALFQNASLIAPIANAITIPLVGFIAVPLSLLGAFCSFFSLSLSHTLWWLASKIIAGVFWILSHLATLPFASHSLALTPIAMISLILMIALLLAPKGFPAKYLSLFLGLPLYFSQPPAIALGQAKLTLLDVGQGLSAVVETAHHTLVFDTGAKFSPEFDLGSAVVVPFLRTEDRPVIDTLVISHGDNDHIGGAHSLITLLTVKNILTSVPDRFPHQATLCLAGMQWQWDGVNFAFLYPTKNDLGQDNNSSCVLKITAGNEYILLTGDIEKSAEDRLLLRSEDIHSTIIVAPHHGSSTSSSPLFLKAVSPSVVLYPVGYLNRYGFPDADVVARYNALNTKSYRSDKNGAITITIGNNLSLHPETYRESHWRFWMTQ
jgi:competence protein ComEC